MKIALATAAGVQGNEAYGDELDEHLIVAALAERDVAAELAVWDDPDVDWAGYDAVVLRSTWDYTERLDEFLAWTKAVEAAGTPLHNSAEVVAWNTHKGYLIELEERGAPIVETAWLGAGDTADLAAIAKDRGWDGVVAKPAIGAGAEGLIVCRPGEDPSAHQAAFAALTATSDTMVQPFVTSIVDGELSIVVIGGVVSHAVRKVPVAGDVRSQIEFGGSYTLEEPDADAAALATWLVEATGHDLLYARVDLLADADGSWMLGELELVEPALMLAWHDASAGRLAAALVARLNI
jgi:glutathione synthase/RimK-type ligase-like ATP-grasp enzyme